MDQQPWSVHLEEFYRRRQHKGHTCPTVNWHQDLKNARHLFFCNYKFQYEISSVLIAWYILLYQIIVGFSDMEEVRTIKAGKKAKWSGGSFFSQLVRNYFVVKTKLHVLILIKWDSLQNENVVCPWGEPYGTVHIILFKKNRLNLS